MKQKNTVRIRQVFDELWGVTDDLQESLKKPKINQIDDIDRSREKIEKVKKGNLGILIMHQTKKSL